MNNIKITSYKNNIELLKILSHPDRMQIVVALMQHTILNVTEFVNMLQIPQAAVSQHLSRMREIFYVVKKRARSLLLLK